MKSFVSALVAAVSVASLSAFAGRDGSEILLQQQQIKRLQAERAKESTPVPNEQQMLENCRRIMTPKQS